jgi:nucleotide-binding universal stress UspA family protein
MNAPQAKDLNPPQPPISHPFRLTRILLTHDRSKAAAQALVDATTLAHQFGSEISIVHVESPEELPLNGMAQSHHEKKYAEAELEEIRDHLTQAGISCRTIVRVGAVADTIANLCVDEGADLVMLGASGYGSQDRHTLGSATICASVPQQWFTEPA